MHINVEKAVFDTVSEKSWITDTGSFRTPKSLITLCKLTMEK